MSKLSGLLEQQPSRLTGLLEQQGSPDAIDAEQVEADRREQLQSDLLDDIIFSSDKKEYTVGEQGFIAQEIMDQLNDPEDFRKDMTNNLILSKMFDLPFNQVSLMDKTMLKEMYGDDLTDLAERFKTNPVEGGFARKMGESVKRGNKAISTDVSFYQAFFQGEGDWRTIMEAADKIELEEALSPIEGNMVSSLFYASGQIVPGMVRGFAEAIPEAMVGMATGAGMALVAGQAGPQVLAAEEVVTVPAAAKFGFKAGLKVGGFTFWYKQGAGSMARSMLKNNVNPDVAREVAQVAAIPYALIELSQASKLTPGVRKKVTAKISKSLAEVVGRATKTYGKTFTSEVWEEVQQEVVAVVAEDVASVLSEEGHTSFDPDTILDIIGAFGDKVTPKWLKERSIRLIDTAKEASKGMALLPGGNFAVDVTTGTVQTISEVRRAKLNEKLPDILSLAPERAELEAQKAGKEILDIGEGEDAKPLEANQEGVVPVGAIPTGDTNGAGQPTFTYPESKVFEIQKRLVDSGYAAEEIQGVAEVIQGGVYSERRTLEGTIDRFIEQDPRNASTQTEESKIKLVKSVLPAEVPSVQTVPESADKPAPAAAISPTPAAEGKRIISQDAFNAARARILDQNVLKAGINPRDFVDLATIGAFHFETGARKFADWSKIMIDDMGEKIKPHLQRIWADVTGSKTGEKVDDDFEDVFDFLEEDLPVAEKAEIQKAKPLSEVKKDALQDVLKDEVFAIESEAADIRKRQVDVGVFFVPKKFRGEVRTAIENDPSLAFNVTFKKTPGVLPFDVAVQEGFLQREGDATDKSLDINEFLERVSEAKKSLAQTGGVSTAVLDKMIKSGEPVAAIRATKHIMLTENQPIDKINDEIRAIAENAGIPADPFLVTTKRGIVGLTREEARAAGKEAATELRAAQQVGEKVGFKAGERASREKAKVEIAKIKAGQKLTDKRRKTAVELVKTFVPKEDQGKFLKRVAEAKTPRDLEKLTAAVEKGIVRAERRSSVKALRAAAKAVKPKKMLPEFAKVVQPILGALKEGSKRDETKAKRSELAQMAQQVVEQTESGSVANVQAANLVANLAVKSSEEIIIDDMSVEEIDNLTEVLQSARFHNEFDTMESMRENSTEAKRRQKEVKAETKKPPAAANTPVGRKLAPVKRLHDNMESTLDAVSGGRSGDYDLWSKTKSAFVKYIYDPINAGVDNQIRHSEQARGILRQILTDNDVSKEDIVEWSARPSQANNIKQAFGFGVKPVEHSIELEDSQGNKKSYTFTTNELMAIYMHTRSVHNLASLQRDGMNRKGKSRTTKDGEFIDGKTKEKMRGFTNEKVDEITGLLTDKQKAVANAVGKQLMDGFNRDELNKTSVELEFFELAKVDNYWPAKRSITRAPRGKGASLLMALVENMGLLKERTGTANPLRLAGFFETVHDSNNNVAAYVGLAKPMRQVNSVYTKDVIEHMENNGREIESKMITDFLDRIQAAAPVSDDIDRMISHFLGNFAKSKLFLNAKIAPRQYLSVELAKAYIDAKYFTAIRATVNKDLVTEVSELSPQLGKARFEGLQFDRDVGDEMAKNDLMFYLTGETSLIDKTAMGMAFFDSMAVLDIYRMVKAEVADKNPDLDLTIDEGKALLKDRFEWIARHTQPMWHVKDRSLIGSDKQIHKRVATMFMSAREVIMRMGLNAVTEYINSDQTFADAARLGKVMSTVVTNVAMFTAYNLAWAALIQRRPKEVEDIYKDFFKNLLTMPFFGEYIATLFDVMFTAATEGKVGFFQRSLSSGPVTGTIEDIIFGFGMNATLAARHMVTGEKYKSGQNKGELKWKNELLVAADSLFNALATRAGLPYYGATDIVKSAKAQITGGKQKKKSKFVPTKRI